MGVFLDVDQECYEDGVHRQIADARQQKGDDLHALLHSGDRLGRYVAWQKARRPLPVLKSLERSPQLLCPFVLYCS